MSPAPSRPFGVLMAVCSAASAGACMVAGKESLDAVAPLSLTFWIFAFALPMTAAFAAVGRRSLRPPAVRGRALRLLLVHVACGFAAIWAAWEGVDRLDPTVAGLLSRLEVVVAVVLGMTILGERFGPRAAVGGVLAVVGAALLGWPEELGARATGVLLMVVSSLAFGLMELAAKVVVREMPPSELTFARNVLLVVAFGAVAASRGDLRLPPSGAVVPVALTALLGPFLARLCFLVSLRHLELSWTALLTQMSPVFTAVGAWLVRDELPERARDWVGGAVILAGCLLLARAERAARRTPVPAPRGPRGPSGTALPS